MRFDAPDGTVVKLPSGEEARVYELLEWEVPCEAPQDWSEGAKEAFKAFWEVRFGRQRTIDASIAAKAEYEYLYDKPYVDNKKVWVTGPFTVESLSPYRTLTVDKNDELIDPQQSLGAIRTSSRWSWRTSRPPECSRPTRKTASASPA